MKLRKAVSLILALILALSMSVPAFAYAPDATDDKIVSTAGGGSNSTGDLTYDSVGSAPVIQVVVPNALGKLIFNPLGLEYDATELLGPKVNSQTSAEEPNMQKDQVITKEQHIRNLSAGNVQVDVKATVTVGNNTTTQRNSDAAPSTSSIDPTSSKAAAKSIFLYMEMYMPNVTVGADGSVTYANASDFTGWKNGDYATKSLPKNYSTLVITAKENKPVEKANVAILKSAVKADGVEASDGDLADLTMDKLMPQTGGVLAFKVSGNATGTLTTGEWQPSDAPDVTLAFTFKFTSLEGTYKT